MCEEAGPGAKVVSLLDRLKSPTPVDIIRVRKTKTNPPPKAYQQQIQTSTLKFWSGMLT